VSGGFRLHHAIYTHEKDIVVERYIQGNDVYDPDVYDPDALLNNNR